MTNSPSPQAVSLRECPFCGGPASSKYWNGGWPDACYSVECDDWKCHGKTRSGDEAIVIAAWNRRASPADGVVVPRGEVTDEWADRFCEAINWSPDGQECKVVEGEMRCATFRQIAKGHILAAIATGPDAASPALAATSGGGEALEAGKYVLVEDMEEHHHPQYGDGFFCTPDAVRLAQPVPAGGGEALVNAFQDAVLQKQRITTRVLNEVADRVQGEYDVARRRLVQALSPPSTDADKLVIAREAYKAGWDSRDGAIIVRPQYRDREAEKYALARLSTTEPTATPADALEGRSDDYDGPDQGMHDTEIEDHDD